MIQVDGLRAFAEALEDVDKEYPKSLRQANYDVASAIVKGSKATATTHSRLARKAAKSLRAMRAGDKSVVTGGGPKYPFFYGAEFGAKQYRQFDAWRGNQWEGWDGGPGYFLHPTIRRDARELINDYVRVLDELHAKAFPS
jgi:hypothetical protein